MSRRHVLEGAERVERQRRLVDKLYRDGLPTRQAVELLEEFQRTLTDQRSSLAVAEKEATARSERRR